MNRNGHRSAALMAAVFILQGVASGQGGLGDIRNPAGSIGVSLPSAPPAPADGYGSAIVTPGDVTGDGVADLVIAAPLHSTPGMVRRGRVEAIDGATGSVIWSLAGSGAEARLGGGLTEWPDLNGDGLNELALVTNVPGQNQVRVSVYSAVPSGIPPAPLLLAQRNLTGVASTDVIPARAHAWRDVTNDGMPEAVVVGVTPSPSLPTGTSPPILQAAMLRLADLASPAGLEVDLATWNQASFHLQGVLAPSGRSVDTSADLNGDGVTEIIFGQPGRIPPNAFLPAAGGVAALDGATLSLLWINTATVEFSQLGASVLALPDLNGDGAPEILAGAPGGPAGSNGSTGGALRLIDGASGGTIQTLLSTASFLPSGLQMFGTSLEREVSSTNVNRYVIGATASVPAAGISGPVAVRVAIGSGVPGNYFNVTQAPASWVVDGAQVAPGDGSVVVPVGDLNLDGAIDWAIGVVDPRPGAATPGRVHLFRSQASVSFGAGPPAVHTLALNGISTPVLGALVLNGAASGSPLLLGLGLAAASPPVPLAGGLLFLDPASPSFGVVPSVATSGNSTCVLQNPPALQLGGFSVLFQVAELSAAAPAGAFLSNAVQLTF